MTAREGLWDFSLRVYRAPGVADWCLALQDGHGADVNILLWAAWLGAAGLLLTAADLAAAEAATRPWRDQVVAPLRAVRRTLRGDVGQVTAGSAVALRTRIQAVELEAERVQQAVLQGLGPAPGAGSRAAVEAAVATNIGFYLRRLGAAANSPPTGLIAVAAAPVGR